MNRRILLTLIKNLLVCLMFKVMTLQVFRVKVLAKKSMERPVVLLWIKREIFMRRI